PNINIGRSNPANNFFIVESIRDSAEVSNLTEAVWIRILWLGKLGGTMNGCSNRSREVARFALRNLIKILRFPKEQQEPITYEELSGLINAELENGSTSARSIGGALGFIRDHICLPKKLPLINVLVVRAKDRLPGDEVFYKKQALETSSIEHLTKEQFKHLIGRLTKDVFSKAHLKTWEKLLGATKTEKKWEEFLEKLREE
ncbi:MAG: hypothetical protein U9Q76_03420, partial [candidate division WOR-3 bacterium]|nr:hypothetical protein [candidate division WOR-3 bacterium]